jgi:glycerol uptake facilitator-like aquaporin
MAEEPINLPSDQNIDYHLVTLFEKLEALRSEKQSSQCTSKLSIKVEIRTLEFWRAVISECLASFIYVFVVCGATAGATAGLSVPSTPLVLLSTALAAGFAMTSLTQCFGHISGN